jgi:DNA-binding MarR family transcriptional regulator
MLSKKLLDSIPQSVRILRRISAESLDQSVTFQQLRILNLVHEGQGPTQMAMSLQISMAAVSKVIDVLDKKKFISKSVGADRRTCVLKLTKKGRSILDKVGKHLMKRLSSGLEKLSDEERKALLEGLVILDQLMIYMKEG